MGLKDRVVEDKENRLQIEEVVLMSKHLEDIIIALKKEERPPRLETVIHDKRYETYEKIYNLEDSGPIMLAATQFQANLIAIKGPAAYITYLDILYNHGS